MLSKDGRVVVIHDATVNRTTNGTGRVSATLAELQTLDAEMANTSRPWKGLETRGSMGDQCRIKRTTLPFDGLPIVVAEMIKRMINGFGGPLPSCLKIRPNPPALPECKTGITDPARHAIKLWRLFQYDALILILRTLMLTWWQQKRRTIDRSAPTPWTIPTIFADWLPWVSTALSPTCH